MGALFLRLSRRRDAFGPEEQEFAKAVAAALANSVRNAKLHASVQRKRDDLELAYVERYRELTEANRRLRELARFKDELIAIISHDLRAPLQVTLGHGRMLEEARLPGDLKTSAEAVVRQSRKILKMVESLLERGKGEQARVALDVQLLDVAKVARDCTFELEILATERGITLRSHSPERLPVMGDELKLREVLQNLITNALEHASENGNVLVEGEVLARPDGPVVKLVVQDDGKGLTDDQLHLVFDRYRHGPGGTGLGLSICKEFVELHGGEIWAERPAGGGCAFVFTLPLAKEDPKVVPRLAPVADGEQPRVLIVEDEPDIAAVLEGILRKRYRVEVARDGREGVAKTHALHPDLVVMDVFLPHIDGLDAVISLKASSDTADIPVILVSAQVGVADRVRALNLGAVDYLAKPFHASELLQRAERALALAVTRRGRPSSESDAAPIIPGDAETGLLDRRGLVARLTQEAARARRYGRPLSLAVARTDAVHPELLRTAAARMRERLRQPDVLAHLGHGTFAALLPECTSEQARTVFGRVESDLQVVHHLALRGGGGRGARAGAARGGPGPSAGAVPTLTPGPGGALGLHPSWSCRSSRFSPSSQLRPVPRSTSRRCERHSRRPPSATPRPRRTRTSSARACSGWPGSIRGAWSSSGWPSPPTPGAPSCSSPSPRHRPGPATPRAPRPPPAPSSSAARTTSRRCSSSVASSSRPTAPSGPARCWPGSGSSPPASRSPTSSRPSSRSRRDAPRRRCARCRSWPTPPATPPASSAWAPRCWSAGSPPPR